MMCREEGKCQGKVYVGMKDGLYCCEDGKWVKVELKDDQVEASGNVQGYVRDIKYVREQLSCTDELALEVVHKACWGSDAR